LRVLVPLFEVCELPVFCFFGRDGQCYFRWDGHVERLLALSVMRWDSGRNSSFISNQRFVVHMLGSIYTCGVFLEE